MSLTLLKVGLIGGAVCGVVAVATATPLFSGRGWTEVLLLAKSKNDKVKLYLQAKVDEKAGEVDEKGPKEYELKAQYNGEVIENKLMLCSPSGEKDKYFLLQLISDSGSFRDWRAMNGKEKYCQYALYSEEDFGDPLSIKFLDEPQNSRFSPPKEIYLSSCEISSLDNGISIEHSKNDKPSWKIICSKDQWGKTTPKVQIVDQGIFYV